MTVAYAGRGATTAIGGKWAGVSGLQSLTQTIDMPATINAGDWLFVMLSGWMKDTDSDGSFTGVPGGWLQIADLTSAGTRTYAGNGKNRLEVWFKIADGTETDFAVTGGSSFGGLSVSGGGQTQWIGECLRFTGTTGCSLLGQTTIDDADNTGTATYPVSFPAGYLGKHVVLTMALVAAEGTGALDQAFSNVQSNTSRTYYGHQGFVTDVSGGIDTTFSAAEFVLGIAFVIGFSRPWGIGIRF